MPPPATTPSGEAQTHRRKTEKKKEGRSDLSAAAAVLCPSEIFVCPLSVIFLRSFTSPMTPTMFSGCSVRLPLTSQVDEPSERAI